MKHLILIISLMITFEANGSSRFFLLSGYGNSATSNSETATEGPLMIQLKLDTNLSNRLVLGIEHSRTIEIDDNTSNISMTNFGLRYHFLNPVENGLTQSVGSEFFSVRNYGFSPYFGLALGFGSASASEEVASRANASALLGQVKFGSLWFFSKKFGLDMDASYAIPFAGSGEIFFLTVGFGIFYNF